MIASIRKNLSCLILKHTSPPPVCRSPVSFSLSHHFFSTSSSRETQLGINPTIFDILLYKHDFPHELASQVASKLTRFENPENADSILSFLKESGFLNTQLEKIVKFRPRILAGSLEDSIKPKIKIFQNLGFSSNEICKLISSNPAILHSSSNDNIFRSLSVLKGLLGSDNEVVRVTRKFSWFLTLNLENSVLRNVEFLKSCGIPMERIRMILSSYPSCFSVKPEVIRKSVEKAKEMGLNPSSKSFIYAIPTIASMSNETWELKLQAFRDLGFSDSDILTMFRKSPTVFCGNKEKIKKIKELLLATGKFDISSIVSSPKSLWCSIEMRYKPRLRILGTLESKNLIKKWPSLGTICVLPDDKFFDRFVRPYSDEVGEVYAKKELSQRQKRDETLNHLDE